MNFINRNEIANGVYFTNIKDSRFNTMKISVNIVVPLSVETASENALVGGLLVRSCKKYPDFTVLSKKLSSLYGADLTSSLLKHGESQVIKISVSGLDDRYSLDDVSIAKELSELLCSVIFEPNVKNNAFIESELEQERRQLLDAIDAEFNDKRGYAISTMLSNMLKNETCGIKRYGSVEEIKKAMLHVSVKGRIEIVPVTKRYTLMIDYAHNAMALESLLTTLKEYEPGRLVCLFGCGGNRSKDRRFEMGEVSGRLADLTIITSDNPRFEEPQAIIDDIVVGMKKTDGKYITICDRKEAIKYAIEHGQPGDVIILAGKGHETYQEIKGVKHDMDERVLIKEVLEELKK